MFSYITDFVNVMVSLYSAIRGETSFVMIRVDQHRWDCKTRSILYNLNCLL